MSACVEDQQDITDLALSGSCLEQSRNTKRWTENKRCSDRRVVQSTSLQLTNEALDRMNGTLENQTGTKFSAEAKSGMVDRGQAREAVLCNVVIVGLGLSAVIQADPPSAQPKELNATTIM